MVKKRAFDLRSNLDVTFYLKKKQDKFVFARMGRKRVLLIYLADLFLKSVM